MSLELREVVWIAVGVLALYAAMQLGRFQGLRKAHRPAPEGASPPAPAPAFGLELEMQQLRRELALLREEVESLGAAGQEFDRRLEAELQTLRDALEGMQAERSISPQYGEAMVFARRGLSAEAVAERCGISVAEAALVCAMAQRAEQRPGEAP